MAFHRYFHLGTDKGMFVQCVFLNGAAGRKGGVVDTTGVPRTPLPFSACLQRTGGRRRWRGLLEGFLLFGEETIRFVIV